jgi:predicted nucleotidyltransferase component of viral defense system
MRISREILILEAERTGFRTEVLEKAAQLLTLLNAIERHPFLKGKLALKGGTALNLFLFNVPRLSVDIDLNYVGAEGREKMLEERPSVDQALQAVFSREGFLLRGEPPDEYAGGMWLLKYQSALGGLGNLEVDTNFLYRIRLAPIRYLPSRSLGAWRASGFPVLDIHEIAAGKLAAFFSRHEARDLFDCRHILSMADLDCELLRILFVAYLGMNPSDLREISENNVEFNANELEHSLIPVLPSNVTRKEESWIKYGERLVDECRRVLKILLPLKRSERKFLDLLRERGEIEPSLLTADTALQDRIRRHPSLLWRVENVRKPRDSS